MEEVSAFQAYSMSTKQNGEPSKKPKKIKNKPNVVQQNKVNHNVNEVVLPVNNSTTQDNTSRKRKRSKKNKNKSNDSNGIEKSLDTTNTMSFSREDISTDDNHMNESKKRKVEKKKKKNNSVSSTQSEKQINGKSSKKKKSSTSSSTNVENEEFTNIVFDIDESSVEQGKKMLRWMIAPIGDDKFFEHNWEQRPIHVIRHCPSYYKTLLSCEIINKALRTRMLYFGKNIDITSYVDGERQTLNPDGRANAPIVWDHYNRGCSIRMLNPQTFFKKIHLLNAKLQEFFGCFVGANVYLTPPDSQGFAPHYDDIEAFVLQIEGKKKWKLYGPRTADDILPRESSGNFKEEELGPVTMEVELQAGDLLYFPRGIIHQACAVEGSHSLHITLSVYQKNSWADLLEKLIPAALSRAIEEDISFRQGLPLNYLDYMGVINSDAMTPQRAEFKSIVQRLLCKLVEYAPVDAAVDQMGKQFQIDALPPCLEKEERCRTVFGDGENIRNGVVTNIAEMQLDTRIRLLRLNAIRLVTEEDKILLYHSINNSLEYHGEVPQFIEVDEDTAPIIEYLVTSYPEYVQVEDFPGEDDILKIQIATTLWENGVLITEEPLSYDSE